MKIYTSNNSDLRKLRNENLYQLCITLQSNEMGQLQPWQKRLSNNCWLLSSKWKRSLPARNYARSNSQFLFLGPNVGLASHLLASRKVCGFLTSLYGRDMLIVIGVALSQRVLFFRNSSFPGQAFQEVRGVRMCTAPRYEQCCSFDLEILLDLWSCFQLHCYIVHADQFSCWEFIFDLCNVVAYILCQLAFMLREPDLWYSCRRLYKVCGVDVSTERLCDWPRNIAVNFFEYISTLNGWLLFSRLAHFSKQAWIALVLRRY